MKFDNVGFCWYRGNQRPFTQYREIMRGKQKGKFEIALSDGKIKLEKQDIIRFPKGGD